MKRYPIFAFRDLNVNSEKAKREIKKIINWNLWNNVQLQYKPSSGLYAINFQIQDPIELPRFLFRLKQVDNGLTFKATFIASSVLEIEWKIMIKERENLLVNIIWFEGKLAKEYYDVFAPVLTNFIAEMNNNFIEYTDKTCLDFLFPNNIFEQALPLN